MKLTVRITLGWGSDDNARRDARRFAAIGANVAKQLVTRNLRLALDERVDGRVAADGARDYAAQGGEN